MVSFYRGVLVPLLQRASSCPTIWPLYRQLGNDLAKVNGDDSWTLPMPGRFVIGRDDVVGYAEVNPDYRRRPEPEELLPVLRAMAVSRAA